MKTQFFCIVLFLFAGSYVFSANTDEVSLTSSDVEAFIESYPSVKADVEKLGVSYDDEHNMTLPEGFTKMNEVNKIVQAHGYSDWMDYYTKAAAILLSYSSIKASKEASEAQPQLKDAIEEIRNNTYYTPEQKEQMIESIKQSMSAMEQISESLADSDNIKVVKPFIEKLDTLLGE